VAPVQVTSVSVTLPARTQAADFALSSSAASAPATAGSIDTLSRDLISLTRRGQPVYIAAVRGKTAAAVEVSADSTAEALVMIRLQMGAAAQDKYQQVRQAIRSHPKYAVLVSLIDASARAGMARPLDVHSNPLLGQLIGQIAEAVAPMVTSRASSGLPRWVAQALFQAMPGSTAWAKSYETTSAGGEVSVVASGSLLAIQNFRAVPWMVSKGGSSTWGVATGRQNGLSFDHPFTAWPVTWQSLDWAKMVSEGSSSNTVSFSAAGLTGTGRETLFLRTYTLGHLATDVLKDVATAGVSAGDAPGTRSLTLLAAPLRTAVAKYQAQPELAEATLLNLLDGMAILSSIGADGTLTADKRRKYGKAQALVARITQLADTFEQVPCWVATAKPVVKGGAALLQGVRAGLESRNFGQATEGQALAMSALTAASDSFAHLDVTISALAGLVPECGDAAAKTKGSAQFWTLLGSGWAEDLAGSAIDDAMPELIRRLAERIASASSPEQVALSAMESLLTQHGEQLSVAQLLLDAAQGDLQPERLLMNLALHLMEDGDIQAIAETVLGSGVKAGISAGAKSSPTFRAVVAGWKVGTGFAVWAWDGLMTPQLLRMSLIDGVVNQIGSPSLKVVVTVDGREVLSQDDAGGAVRRVLDKIDVPVGAQLKVVVTANQPGMFTAAKDGLAHKSLDGSSLVGAQQPTMLHEALLYAAKAAGGQRSLVHRMLCTRDNASSLYKKQYSQIDMADVYGGYQCQDAYSTPYVFGLGGNELEKAAFTPAGNVKVVRDYTDNFADGEQPGFSSLDKVYAASNNSVFEYTGTVQESWKSLHIEFTHFEYAERHAFTIPLSLPPEPPKASLGATWAGSISGQNPRAGDVVSWVARGTHPRSPMSAYEIDFGDGSPKVGVSSAEPSWLTQHSYAQPGSYVTELTVTDAAGGVGRVQQTVIVRAPGSAPTVAFEGLIPILPLNSAVTGFVRLADADGDQVRNVRVHVGRALDGSDCQIDVGPYDQLQATGLKSFSGCSAMTSTAGTLYLKAQARDSTGLAATMARSSVMVGGSVPPRTEVTQDTTVLSSHDASWSPVFGSTGDMTACGAGWQGTGQAFIQFDHDRIPEAATAVHLNLYTLAGDDVYGVGTMLDVLRVATNWSESTTQWISRPVLAESHGNFTVLPGGTEGWVRIPVTSLVKTWQKGTYPNRGVALWGVTQTQVGCRVYASRESAGKQPYVSWE
jgi:hypothetical protein